MTIPEQQFVRKVHEVVEFCLKHQGKCFGGWPRETIFIYVAFHAFSKTLFVMRDNDKVKAVAFSWPCGQDHVADDFNWHLPAHGDCLMVREVIGSRQDCQLMLTSAKLRWPQIKRFFAFRIKGGLRKLHEFQNSAIERFAT